MSEGVSITVFTGIETADIEIIDRPGTGAAWTAQGLSVRSLREIANAFETAAAFIERDDPKSVTRTQISLDVSIEWGVQ